MRGSRDLTSRKFSWRNKGDGMENGFPIPEIGKCTRGIDQSHEEFEWRKTRGNDRDYKFVN